MSQSAGVLGLLLAPEWY